MKLKSIRLQKVRNHEDSTLEFTGASLVCVRGANASGKSSIGQAISINLTNSTMGLDNQGRGFESKIKDGESKGVITAEIQGKHLLLNIVTLNTNSSGRTSKVECLDEPEDNKIINGFKSFLADRKSALMIALNTDHFSRQEEKEQANLLAKLVMPSHYDFPDDKMDAVDAALGEGVINFDGDPFEVITSAYKKLYKERETVNRQVKEFVIPDPLPMVKGVDSASLQAQLSEVRAQRSKLQQERDAAVAKANEVEVKRGRLQTRIEGLRAELDRGKKRLALLESEILSAEKIQEYVSIAAKEEELTNLKSLHSGLFGGMKTLREQIDRLKSISDKGATCPTCDQAIDSNRITGLIDDLEKEYGEADQKIQELDKQIEAIGDVESARQSLQKNTVAVKQKEELEKELAKIVREGKDTKSGIDATGEKVDATLPFNDPLALVETKINNILEQLRPVIAAEERVKEIERLREQKKKLVAKAASLDTLVKYFDKDGIKATLIAQYIGGFESKINSVLSAWGYKTTLTMDPFSFETTTPRGYVGPVKELSGAEEHIFKAAFQCAVSIAAGINFVVIDEVEELGTDIRQALFATVYGLIQEGILEQAILIGFSLDKTLPKPQAPGSKYFYVENGTVEELK
jgi:hypothetical protein